MFYFVEEMSVEKININQWQLSKAWLKLTKIS